MSGPPEQRPLGLFDGVLARGAVREAVGDGAWLRAMLDVEAALATASARAGLFGMEEARAIARACQEERFDIDALARAASETGNPVPALVKTLTSMVDEPARAHVHRGATSQDVVDTAAMLVAKRALGPLLADLNGAADAAASLATKHRATLMAGRTLLQQALPVTFGLKAAVWLSGLDGAASRLDEVRSRRLAVQLGGAAGTLASLGDRGPVVLAYFAEELDLAVPIVPWHAERTRVAELAAALGEAAGAIGKPARDVTLLAQTEVGEVREGRAGGSSTLPQKQNPVAAVSAIGCALRAPGLVATLFTAMVHEHERAAGAWHAEWLALRDLFTTVGSAASWLRECLEHLEIDGARMRENLDRAGGVLLAERVTTALTPALGRLAAHDLVADACRKAVDGGQLFAVALGAQPAIASRLAPAAIDALLDPSEYLGSTSVFIDRALAAHAARGQGPA